MKWYLSTIGAAMAIIAIANVAADTAPWQYVLLATVWCTALQFALDGAVAILIRLLPDRYFGVDNRHFAVSEREQKLYRLLKVRHWKDRVWELGGLGGFSKKQLADPKNPAYIETFIVECNKGVVTHRLSYPIGFAAMLMVEGVTALTIALPVAAVNLYLNILPTLVLRYNTPTLQRLLRRMNKKNLAETLEK